MTALHFLPIEDIRRRPDARPLDDVALAGLAESIDSIGLINPIRVRQVNGGFEVIAGGHRFAACDSLGHREIACLVVDDDDLHAEMAMIDENLWRAELSPVDRGKLLARRKAIYKGLHQETMQGGNWQSGQFGHTDTPSFVEETAKITGIAERTIRRDVERGEKIVPEVLDAIRGTPLDRGVHLDRFKRIAPEAQWETAKRELDGIRTGGQRGGIAAQYARVETPAPPDNPGLYARFIKAADEIEAIDVASLINGAGRQRAVLGQRASGIADRMCAIMEGLDQ